jgi:hypothetical protein
MIEYKNSQEYVIPKIDINFCTQRVIFKYLITGT